jgi:hypothetical protein
MTQGRKSCGTGGSFRIIHKRNSNGDVISGIKEMKFGDIYDLIITNKLKTPDFQRIINKTIVNEMIETFLQDSSLIKEVGYIFLCDLHNDVYVIDGQHRIEMIKKLITESNHDYRNETIAVNVKKCENFDELNNLYNVLNKNKTKIGIPVEIRNTFEGQILEKFKLILKNNYKQFFSSSRTNKYKYFIDEFIEELIDNQILSKYKIKNENELINFILEKNNKINNFKNIDVKYYENLFYKSEIDCINQNIYFTLKRGNFINMLKNDTEYDFLPKHIKEKIPKKLKHTVWKNFTNKTEIKCPIKKCKNLISFDNFHVGHIISEYNGGKLEESNLKPICQNCNLQMSTKNWTDFDK